MKRLHDACRLRSLDAHLIRGVGKRRAMSVRLTRRRACLTSWRGRVNLARAQRG